MLHARSNVKVLQSISVPVSCAPNKAEIDVNESCYNATSSLNPYSKPFESKTLCAYNTFASDPSNLKDGRVSPQLSVGLSSGLVGSTRSVMQQPVLPGSHEVNNIANTVSQSDFSSSSFTKLPTLKVEPPFFNGNSADYFSFIKTFDVLIDQPLADPCRKRFFLLHYTKNIAHSLIKECQHMPPERGYQEARMLLQSYFGQKHKIIEACSRTIVKGPVLNEHDHRDLIKFSAEFTSCLITLEGMECLDRMDNMDMVTKIVHRLPPSWISGWKYEVDQIMHVMHRDISIKNLEDFVRRKTRETTNLSQIPTFSRPPNSQEKNASRKATTFSTQVKNNKASSAPKCQLSLILHHFFAVCQRQVQL